MADVKISALPAATTPLDGTELAPIVQSGTTKRVTVANLTVGRALTASSLTLTTPLSASNGGTGQSSYATGDLLYANATNSLAKLPVGGNHCYLGTDATNMPQWVSVGYGAFYGTTSSAFTANTPTVIPFDGTALERNITLASNKITVTQTGTYTITTSAQLTNNSASDDDFILWLRVNGADVPNSASYSSVIKKHGTDPGSAILAVNFFYQFTAGDYFELYGLSKLGYANIHTYAASSSPAYPQSPGVILTVAQVV